jgi:hypothetical protein
MIATMAPGRPIAMPMIASVVTAGLFSSAALAEEEGDEEGEEDEEDEEEDPVKS